MIKHKKKPRCKQFHLRLTEEDKTRLEQQARKEYRTMTEMLQWMIRCYFLDQNKKGEIK